MDNVENVNTEIIAKLAASDNENELKRLFEAHLGAPKKVSYFLKVFRASVSSFGRIEWSLGSAFSFWAFLFGPFYLCYRKLYSIGAIFMSCQLLVLFAVSNVGLGLTLSIILSIIMGVTAPYFYIKKFCADAILAGYGTQDIDMVIKEISKRGGRNIMAALFSWVIFTFLILLLQTVFMMSAYTMP